MVTIREVASEANVSISTVSRVLNNNPNVTRDKYNRVMEAIEKVGYIPAVKEKSQNGTIAGGSGDPAFKGYILIVATIIVKELVFSIQENACDLGYEVIINYIGGKESANNVNLDLHLFRYLDESGKLAGIIVINPSLSKEMYSDEIFSKYPVVQVGCSNPVLGDFLVSTDDFRGANEMTAYLLEKGYRRIVMATGAKEEQSSYMSQRERGFSVAMRDAGIPDEEIRYLRAEVTPHGGHVLARELAAKERAELPEAIFCISDYMAIGLVYELEKHGIRVPEDIAVASFNPEGDYTRDITPRLTTIVQSFDEIGAESVRMLGMLADNEVSVGRKSYIGYHLVKGDTA